MQGFRYFLVVLTAIAGLSLGIHLVYSRLPESSVAPAAAAPAAVVNSPRAEAPPATPQRAPTASQVNRSSPSAVVARRSSRAPVARKAPVPNGRITSDSSLGVLEMPPRLTLDTVLPTVPEPVVPWQATPRQLARDSAYVMARSGRLQAAILVLDSWVKEHPADSAVAIDLASLRARAGDYPGSIAQYSTLIQQHRTAQLLYERGQVYLWSGDTKRGEADLLESERLEPRAETERQLGDHYRWQGDFSKSRVWYGRALRSAPGDSSVRQSMDLLDRALDARLLMPGELAGRDLGSGAQVVSDNAGFDLYVLRVANAVALGSGSALTISGELRSASSMSLATGESDVDGYGVDIGLSSRVGTSKLTASLGVLDHGSDTRLVRGSLAADAFLGSARLKASVRQSPAYEALWAPRLLDVAGSPETALQGQSSISLPLGGMEWYAMGELLAVSDDNTRVGGQLAIRKRLPGMVSLVYSGSVMSYDRQVPLYYSPSRYVSQALGLELSRYRDQGFSFSLRATPGYAWMKEPAGTADSTTMDVSAFQFATSLDLGYRRGAWDLLFSSGTANGREGGYRSHSAWLFLRRSW